MKLLNKELYKRRWDVAQGKVLKYAPYGGPVCIQIRKNFGLWRSNDSLITRKLHNLKVNIGGDLDEIT